MHFYNLYHNMLSLIGCITIPKMFKSEKKKKVCLLGVMQHDS